MGASKNFHVAFGRLDSAGVEPKSQYNMLPAICQVKFSKNTKKFRFLKLPGCHFQFYQLFTNKKFFIPLLTTAFIYVIM